MHRRSALAALAAAGTALSGARPALAGTLSRPIAGGARLPVVGMGTWITFNVGNDERLRRARLEVLRAFFEAGGGMIDSSPMYGSSEEVVGWCLRRLERTDGLFAASKVWTPIGWHGKRQMEESERLWGGRRMDLQQVHNLLAWESHLPTLRAWQADGRLRYVGVTTSHGRRHQELAAVMREQAPDFVQLTYNVVDRDAERRLLPLAAERGIAVIVNRPYRRGALPERLRGRPLPGFAAELGCRSWAQLLLKFVLSHPAVTCAIPATTRVAHMRENMEAGRAPLPDAALRERIVEAVDRT